MQILNSFSKRLNSHFSLVRKGLLMTFPRLYGKPLRITIYVTDMCNSRCPTCYFWKNKGISGIAKEYIFKFIDETFRLSCPQIVTLTGGEPLLRNDIFDIVKFIHLKGGRSRILTNGLLLVPRIIDKLVLNKLSSLCISINAIDQEIHDSSRGVKGNLRKIFTAVEYIKKNHPELKIEFSMILFKQNLDQIIPTIKYAESVGASINFQPIQPVFDVHRHADSRREAEKTFQEFFPKDNKKILELFRQIKNLKRNGYKISVLNSYLKLYSDYFNNPSAKNHRRNQLDFFNIQLCNNGDIKLASGNPPVGNIIHSNVKDIWFGKEASIQRSKMLSCRKDSTCLCNLTPNFTDILKEEAYFLRRKISIKNLFKIA